MQRVEVPAAGRGSRDRDHSYVTMSAYDAIPVLRNGALHGEQGAIRTAGKRTCMVHDICVHETVNVSSTDQYQHRKMKSTGYRCRTGSCMKTAIMLQLMPYALHCSSLLRSLLARVSQLFDGSLKRGRCIRCLKLSM